MLINKIPLYWMEFGLRMETKAIENLSTLEKVRFRVDYRGCKVEHDSLIQPRDFWRSVAGYILGLVCERIGKSNDNERLLYHSACAWADALGQIPYDKSRFEVPQFTVGHLPTSVNFFADTYSLIVTDVIHKYDGLCSGKKREIFVAADLAGPRLVHVLAHEFMHAAFHTVGDDDNYDDETLVDYAACLMSQCITTAVYE